MMKKVCAVLMIGLFCVVAVSGLAEAKKPVVGVAEFKNTSGAAWWRGGMGWELAGMVTSELASGKKFDVVERNKLEHVLREQDLGASGRVARGTAAQIGKLTGAQYLIMGTVTAYEESVKGTGGGFRIGSVSIGGKKQDAYLSLDLRVVDTTTGKIAESRAIEARSSGGGLSGGLHFGSFSGNLGGFEKTPAGKAVRACIIEIVEYLECSMVYKDDCMQEYDAKETRRREKTKKSIKLD
jgi:curli biogenesis system outer membrane secretion channel CsgG